MPFMMPDGDSEPAGAAHVGYGGGKACRRDRDRRRRTGVGPVYPQEASDLALPADHDDAQRDRTENVAGPVYRANSPCRAPPDTSIIPVSGGGMKAGLLLVALGAVAYAQAPVARQVTFTKDVAPIFQNACQNCHRPG